MDYTKPIHKIYKEQLNQTVLNIQNTSKGYENKVFIVSTNKGASVIRIPIEKEGNDNFSGKYQALRERWTSEAWSKIGIPVPKIIKYDESRKLADFDYIIETKIEGEDLADSELNDNQMKSIMINIGKYLKKMHTIKTKKYGFLINDLEGSHESWQSLSWWSEPTLENLLSKKLISSEQYKGLKNYFQENTHVLEFNDPRLLHNDIRDENIMILDGKISGIIDLGDAVSGDPMYDVGRTYQGLYGLAHLDDFLKAYGKIDEEKFRYFLLYHACWISEFYYDNVDKKAIPIIKRVLDKDIKLD